jgi:hypothetical protein
MTEDSRVPAGIGDSSDALEALLEVFSELHGHGHDGSPGMIGGDHVHLSVQKEQPLENTEPYGLTRLVKSSLALLVKLVGHLAERDER